MYLVRTVCLCAALLFCASLPSLAVRPTTTEINTARTWVQQNFAGGKKASQPFSFTYGGRPSSVILGTWKRTAQRKKLSEGRTQITQTYTDPKTGLQVKCVITEYADFPTCEWTVYLRNNGKADTPIIADLQALNSSFSKKRGDFVLNYHDGDATGEPYRPHAEVLAPGASKQFAPEAGRSCSLQYPYFNVGWDGGGALLAIGWPGQWAAKFDRNSDNGLKVMAGQETTHLVLHPGEQIRTPLIVMQFYKGDRARSQNIWRRWMLVHNMPKPGGKPLKPQMAMCSTNYYGYWDTTEENQKMWADRYAEEDLTPDLWWVDLGWFDIDRNTLIYKGFFEPQPQHFPNGLKPLSDHVHKLGSKLLVWFEPEHLYPGPGNWLCDNHPEWLLSAPPGRENEINQGMPLKNRKVLNLGDPDALKWLTDTVDGIIKKQGIDHYRHDFNIAPLIFWQNHDAPDRQGITENKYVQGFLKYYDELLRRNPGMFIDNCASGGRRNDVETLRRSVPLLKSDSLEEPVGQQCQTYGLVNWVPYCGTGMYNSDPNVVAYVFRSQISPHFTSGWDLRENGKDYSYLRKLVAEWRDYGPCLMGDYYALVPYSRANDVWMAWQYDLPEKGEGIVQAFRRGDCPEEQVTVKLSALNAKATYTLTDLDTGVVWKMAGKQLMTTGIQIKLTEKPSSAVMTYRRN